MAAQVLPQIGAVGLAAAGAVLFGLAAVRQHGAVVESVSKTRLSIRQHLGSAWELVRQRSWLIGTAQASVGAGLHVVALALAPITLVQPVGVLAVPVTVMASAARQHRRPARVQWFGVALSVIGIAVLTVLLLIPGVQPGRIPGVAALAATVGGLLAAGVLVTVTGGRGRPLVRCVSLALAAAALFGLNSILLRTIGEVLVGQTVAHHVAILVVAVVGICCALPLGVWAMQTAYLSGAPQVVICCLTLMDPLTAVIGGRLLLHDGGPLSGPTLFSVLGCAVVTAVGVVLLSAGYPTDAAPVPAGPTDLADVAPKP